MSKAKKYLDSIFNETSDTAIKKQYIIMKQFGSRAPEKVDSANDEPSADYLVNEYQTALGPKWKVWKTLNK